MKPKLHISDLLILIIILLPYLYLQLVYNSLPARVPTHFNLQGLPNDYSNRSFMWVTVSLIAGVCILLYLLLRFLPVIDPKKTAKYSAGVFNKIAVVVVLLLSAINALSINAAQTGQFKFSGVLPVLIGVFFAFMGNIMHSIKPNYFAGIRTPWTLENEETWRKTHRLGGKLWFAGGLIIAISAFVVPAGAETYVILASVAVLVLVPVIYSYICFKSIQKNN